MKPFELMTSMGHEQVVFCNDPSSGLKAIIAIHNSTLGPALGGTRMWPYESEEAALEDVLRLSRGMTYKAAITGLALGGGKAVIIGDPSMKSQALFRAYGRFVESLGGRYITAEDVNIKPADMEYVAMETKSVTGLTAQGGSGDPSPVTALGVFYGIESAVKYKLGKDSLKGLRVAVQGLGAVGTSLCGYLHEAGALLTIADIKDEKVRELKEKYGATVTDPNSIHGAEVDVFAPCALGAGLNDETIPDIKAIIVAGAANNQMADEDRHGIMLRDRGILYAPDYVINAGGLINVYHELKGYNEVAAKAKAREIYDTLLEVYKEAENQGIPTHEASDAVAERRIDAVAKSPTMKDSFYNCHWINRS